MKDKSSYISPLIGLTAIAYCDFAILKMNFLTFGSLTHPTLLIAVLVYNFVIFMVLWSLFATMCNDPGYVPLNETYNTDKLSRIVNAIYLSIMKY
jgi:hypothetical protein